MTKSDVYQVVTDRILAKLESGVVPWRKSWATSKGGLPKNLLSQKPYRGINVFSLGMTDFGSPYWLTFNQARQIGASVKAGEKGMPVMFWKWLDAKTPEERAQGKKIPCGRYYTAFNVEQCEGFSGKLAELLKPQDQSSVFNPIEACEKLVAGFKNPPEIKHGGESACYMPILDMVKMPAALTFAQAPDYYSTLFHELGHATGHEKRLKRPGITNPDRFASHQYSQEELVAEMTAAYLCALTGVEQKTLDNSAAYIGHWLKVLRNDRKLLVTAAAQAQKAVDCITGATFGEEKEA